ncbi:MAG: DUF362 domain-containing protein [Candidatus Aminicenantes bacterium]|nr:DUF362 domain-containing protein [Candidatus Aminicenantes bacterium]
MSRRDFFHMTAGGVACLAVPSSSSSQEKVQEHAPDTKQPPKIQTNIEEIRNIPKTGDSMPGKYPGKVVKLSNVNASNNGNIDRNKVSECMKKGMLALTGKSDLKSAWSEFVRPDDVVGIKVNPIGGKLLSTKPEVVEEIIQGILSVGVPKERIIIWDRRMFQLAEAGFTAERFPGIEISGTEMEGPKGDFYTTEGELWSRDNIDREYAPYFADIEGKYDKETLPYMINEGKYSYFTKILTEKCTRIINVPVLKNAGAAVTLCLKNLAYGSLSNTSRLHRLWNESVAEPCAFPCLRDKVSLNIVDGLQACYDGGPGANPKFIWDANIMLFGTDPVAVDTIGYKFILKERMERGVQQLEDKRRRAFLENAENLGLGTCQEDKINLTEIDLN